MPVLRNSKTTILAAFCVAGSAQLALAQFDPGSDGSDGALDFTGTAPGTVIEFDPTTFDPPLDPDGDSVYHFTTITIPEGVTVKMRAMSGGSSPIYWLAQGDIVIDGTIDAAGDDGHTPGSPQRSSALPGPGGFGGGLGATAVLLPTDGLGPGGGKTIMRLTNDDAGSGAGHAVPGRTGASGPLGGDSYGSQFVMPLLGGSGGGGTSAPSYGPDGGGGGAGGGALLFATATRITVDGEVTVRGGNGGLREDINNPTIRRFTAGGGGSGGALRFIAPVVDGAGRIDASGGFGSPPDSSPSLEGSGSLGFIRVETWQIGQQLEFLSQATIVPLATQTPILPEAIPSAVRIISVDGQAVDMGEQGMLGSPDVVLDNPLPVEVQLEASGIPLGTELRLSIYSVEVGEVTATSTPLAGTVEASTATATIQFPPNVSQLFVRASWTP